MSVRNDFLTPDDFTQMESDKEKKSGIEDLFHQAMEYADTRVDLFKLQAVNKVTEVSSSLLSKLVVIFIFLIAVGLVSIGLAIYVGRLLGAIEYGFFAMGGLIIIIGGIFYALRHKLMKAPIGASLIKKALK